MGNVGNVEENLHFILHENKGINIYFHETIAVKIKFLKLSISMLCIKYKLKTHTAENYVDFMHWKCININKTTSNSVWFYLWVASESNEVCEGYIEDFN